MDRQNDRLEDDLAYQEYTTDPEQAWEADEFGEKIPSQDDSTVIDDDTDPLAEDELISTTTVGDSVDPMDMDSTGTRAMDNDAEFHETLKDPSVADQLTDEDQAVDDTEADRAVGSDGHESLMDRAKTKFEDIKREF